MLITVFTPAYNRAYSIGRIYESLQNQKYKEFEWLIIDDGSTDNTFEMISGFQSNCNFSIRYIRKNNGGKHTAYNLALDKAKGDLLFVVDSDDWLPENSLSDIASMAEKIKFDSSVCGIIALKNSTDGTTIGKTYSKENYYATFRDLELTGQSGERSIVFKTEIARKFRFPVIKGERFMPENVAYDKFNAYYKLLVSNKSLTICEYQKDGLSSNPRKLMMSSPGGYYLYYRNRIDMATSVNERIGYIIRYNAFRALYKGHDVEPYRGAYRHLCKILKIATPLILKYYRRNSK